MFGNRINLKRALTIAHREWTELYRDPLRLFFCFIVPIVLMFIFGYGLNIDIEHIPYGVIDHDQTQESRQYLDHFRQSRYFQEIANVNSEKEAETLFLKGKIRLLIEMPNRFGADLLSQRSPAVYFGMDGAMPYRADTLIGYVTAMNQGILHAYAKQHGEITHGVSMQTRFWYNQTLESKYTFVPGLMSINLLTFSAVMIATALVRERELGTIMNFYATPVTRLEFLLGKQLTYIIIAFINTINLALMTVFLFGVPLKGSLLAFALGSLAYVTAATSLGVLVAAFTRTQLSALLVTMIATMIPSFIYSGLLVPVSSLEGSARQMAYFFPPMYFLNICVGVFTKALPFAANVRNILALVGFSVVFMFASILLTSKQER